MLESLPPRLVARIVPPLLALSVAALACTPLSSGTDQVLLDGSATTADAAPPEASLDDGSSETSLSDGPSETSLADAGACFPRPSGLISWWRTEGTPTDSTGMNGGTATNVTYVTGMVGQAAHFSGDGYISAGSAQFPIQADDRTIEMWVRIAIPYIATPPTLSQGFFLGYGAWGDTYGTFELLVAGGGAENYPENTLAFSQWGNSVGGSTQTSITENQWHHVAATLASGTLTLYLDGAITTTGSGLLEIKTGPDGTTYIGGLSPTVSVGQGLTGDIDEAAVYTRALSADEIGGIFHAGSAGKCP